MFQHRLSYLQMMPLACMLVGAFSGCTGDATSHEDACIANSWQAVEAEKKADYSSAENHYSQALNHAEQSNNALQLPKVLQGLAELYVKEQKYPQAETSLRRAIERYKAIEKESRLTTADRLDMLDGRVKALEALAGVMVTEGKSNDAELLYREALALSKDSGGLVDSDIRISKSYANLLKSMHRDEDADHLLIQTDADTMTANDVNHTLDLQMPLVLETGNDLAGFIRQLQSLALASARLHKEDQTSAVFILKAWQH